jgi:methylated-DNA-[protein]-cysteine S-methyltransferase
VFYYTLFTTQWGFFGLAGGERGVCRTCLPLPSSDAVRRQLLLGLTQAKEEPSLFRDLEPRIVSYFEGLKVHLLDVSLDLDGLAGFTRLVLEACRKIDFGQTVTYGDLARTIGNPRASRAVGGALARNPIPLVIPCHRVIRGTGGLGGFSAPGGIEYKDRLLQHECRAPAAPKGRR